MSTLTLNLDDRHDEVLTSLAAEQELSKTALMRQALRLYQTVHLELKRGRQLAFQNPDGSFVSMVMLGGPMAAEAAPVQQEALGEKWFAVLTPSRAEGVIFKNKRDARYAATGNLGGRFGVPTIAYGFREAYEESDKFETIEVAALQPTQGAKEA